MSQPLLSPEPHDDPEKKKILNLYAAMGISMALTLVPNFTVATVAGIFLMGVLISAYFTRRNVEIHGLAGNHCTYIIRTIVLSAVFSLITMTIASLLILPGIDYSAIEVCANDFANQNLDRMTSVSYGDLFSQSQPCMDEFMNANYQGFVMYAALAGGPILIYFLYRFTKGLSRAIKGYRVPDPKAWL